MAGKLSGLLGYIAFDLGNELLARAYCNEAIRRLSQIGERHRPADQHSSMSA
ncbi:hypothetical protein [Frankia sp. Cr1]|uniref:hypothetical protein n=1 Tax=Frankia sp. Cr1 TaxID=3073931 RepID=UPI002AD37B9F|nr:hypothetical protein [Frankia sp. Cr1]